LQEAQGGDRESVQRRGLGECRIAPAGGELACRGAADRDRRSMVEQAREILLASARASSVTAEGLAKVTAPTAPRSIQARHSDTSSAAPSVR